MKKLSLLFLILSLNLYAQLSGDYYIPQGSNPQGFSTLAAACSALTADGASGTVRFLIDDNLAETGANLFISRSDLNATNNLVIKPASGKTPTISITGCTATAGATQYAGFTLNNTGFVTIDGSNTTGGTTRDLTFLMNDATGRDAVNLFGNCDDVTLKNFKVRYIGIQSATVGRGIYLNGQATGAADNCVIDNCEIGENSGTLVGPHHGIGYTGSSGSSIYCMNGTISNNLIYANIRGINLFWHNGAGSTMNVFGNTISIMNPASGNVIWGILHQAYTGTTNFYNNRIHSMTQKSTGTQGIYGFGTLAGVVGSGTVTNVYNNFFGGNFNHTSTGVPASVDVISFQDNPASSIVRVYHNTVVLNNFTNKSTTRNTCIRFNPVSTQTFEIRNNIFINNMVSSVAYVFHYGGGTALNFTSNFNVAYVSDASAHIGLATSNRTTLSAWSTAFTPNQDVNSVSKNVILVNSENDFHLAGSSIGDNDLFALPISGYTTDIDGQTRIWGYKGADEVTTHPIPLTNWTVPMNPAATNAQAFGNTSRIGSDGGGIDFYATWDATYLYLGWSGGRTNYSSDMYYAAIDTDPDGTNGTTNAIEGVGFITGAQRPDYYVVYENNSTFYGVPASEGNSFEVYNVSGGNWNFVSRTVGDDGTSSQIVFANGGGEVRLRVPWATLGGFTPGAANKLGIVMWNNNPDGNYMWARVPNSNPANGSTPITLTNNFRFNSTAVGINPAADAEDALLPVELVSFTAKVIKNNVELNWSTATEVNNYGFEVERSVDKTNWNKLGFVAGSGNSNSPKDYSFVDKNPAEGKAYYRLKQIDLDGQMDYSQIIEVEISNTVPTAYNLYQNYPNPFNPSTTIRYSIPKASDVRLMVYTINGELVKELVNSRQSAGEYNVSFEGRELSSGTYIYRIIAVDINSGENFVQTKKMILVK